MADKRIIIPYKPRPLQRKLHDSVGRFAVCVCHRRFGKTVFAVNKVLKDLVHRKIQGMSAPRGYYCAPVLKQAKRVAWDYIKLYCRDLPGYKSNESDMYVQFMDDCKFFLMGADNPDAERGIYSDSTVLDEYAQMPPSMWTEIFRPASSDRKGNALFIGTPKGKNAFYNLYKDAEFKKGWSRHMFKASETGYVDQEELELAKQDMSPEEYEQEYECSWEAAIKGAYYGKLLEKLDNNGHIIGVPYDPIVLTVTSWDLGVDDSTAIWFDQVTGFEHHLIDYYENSGQGLDHYAGVLREKAYSYGQHIFPHDVRVRELSSGRTRLEMLSGLGINAFVAPNIPIDDGINAVRALLPKCYFDKIKCEKGIEALRQYRTSWDERTQTFRQRPHHDWTSHAADAFRYLALGVQEVKKGPRQAVAISDYGKLQRVTKNNGEGNYYETIIPTGGPLI